LKAPFSFRHAGQQWRAAAFLLQHRRPTPMTLFPFSPLSPPPPSFKRMDSLIFIAEGEKASPGFSLPDFRVFFGQQRKKLAFFSFARERGLRDLKEFAEQFLTISPSSGLDGSPLIKEGEPLPPAGRAAFPATGRRSWRRHRGWIWRSFLPCSPFPLLSYCVEDLFLLLFAILAVRLSF